MTALKLAIATLTAVLCGTAAGRAGGTAERKFSLPDRGALVVQAPRAWRDETGQQPGMPWPVIRFVPREGPAFEIHVSPIWPAAKDRPPPTREALRAQVERRLEGIRPEAVEKDIRIVEFQGRSGAGFYFAATDRAPKPGEFKFMTQGNVQVGGLSVLFTILTNDGQDAVVKQALDMLRGAAHDDAAR